MTNDALKVVAITELSQLEQYAARWNALAESSPQQLPLASHAWSTSFIEHCLPKNARWAVLFAFRGERMVGALVAMEEGRKQFGWAYRACSTLHDQHSQIGDLLLATDIDTAATAQAMVDELFRFFPAAWSLTIFRYPETSPLHALIQAGTFGRFVLVDLQGFGAYLPVPRDYQAFRGGLSKNFRSNLNKAANKISSLSNASTSFVIGRDATPAHFEQFLPVEASGWKGQEGTAIAKSDQLIAFYRRLTERLRDAGWLQWDCLYGDDRLLAGNLSIRMPKSVVVWKLGYDDGYSKMSPGSILMENLLKAESERGQIEEINLTTDMAWYDNWQMQRRPYYTAIIYRHPAAILGQFLPARLMELLRRMPAYHRIKAITLRLLGRTPPAG